MTGIITNDKLGPARITRRQIRAIIHAISCGRQPYLIDAELNRSKLGRVKLHGLLNYWKSLDPALIPDWVFSKIRGDEMEWEDTTALTIPTSNN